MQAGNRLQEGVNWLHKQAKRAGVSLNNLGRSVRYRRLAMLFRLAFHGCCGVCVCMRIVL